MPWATAGANYARNNIFITGGFSADLWVALHSANPGAGGSNELSGNAYARVQLDPGASNWDNTVAAQTQNLVAIEFPTATPSGWSEATHFSIWDAATTGTMLGYAALTTPKTVGAGETGRFNINALDVLFPTT